MQFVNLTPFHSMAFQSLDLAGDLGRLFGRHDRAVHDHSQSIFTTG